MACMSAEAQTPRGHCMKCIFAYDVHVHNMMHNAQCLNGMDQCMLGLAPQEVTVSNAQCTTLEWCERVHVGACTQCVYEVHTPPSSEPESSAPRTKCRLHANVQEGTEKLLLQLIPTLTACLGL
eukprot:867223-Pelagomonas_calceolata.AAC.5